MLAINEFGGPGPDGRYNALTVGAGGVKKRVGDLYLDNFAMSNDKAYVGYGFAYLFGSSVVFFIMYVCALHYRRHTHEAQIVLRRHLRRTKRIWDDDGDGDGSHTRNQLEPLVLESLVSRILCRRCWAEMFWRSATSVRDDSLLDEDEEDTASHERRADGAVASLQHVSFGVPKVDVVLRALRYAVKGKRKKDAEIVLLDDINAYFKPGTVAAIMGPPKAGAVCIHIHAGLRIRRVSFDMSCTPMFTLCASHVHVMTHSCSWAHIHMRAHMCNEFLAPI